MNGRRVLAAMGLVGLALAAAPTWFWISRGMHTSRETRRLAVLEFEGGAGLAARLAERLAAVPELELMRVERTPIEAAIDDAKARGAELLVLGTLAPSAGAVELRLRLVRADGTQVERWTVTLPAEEAALFVEGKAGAIASAAMGRRIKLP